jgi:hypothetical protein
MGKIGDYTPMGGAPEAGDMLFIADIDGAPSNEIKSITVANLHKTDTIIAATSAGITITDDGSTHGIEVHDGGNVGIGAGYATTPTSYLDVRGGSDADLTLAQFLNPSAITNGRITQILVGTDRASYKSLALRYTYDVTNDDGLITLRHYEDATEGIHLKGDGNVGIGQTAPTSKLHIGDGSATPSLRVQGSSSDVYLYTDATNGPGVKSGSGDELHLQKGYGGGSNTNLYCFYNTALISASDPVTPLMIQSSDGNVGIGTNSPSGTLEISTAVDDALFIYSRDAAKNARIRLLTSTGTNTYIQDDKLGFVAIGGTSSLAASNCLQIAKANGRISIGGTLGTFNYAITTQSNPATQAYFSNGSGDKSHIYITNTTSSVTAGAVVYGNETVTNKARWMCGQFWAGTPSHNYFGFEYLGDASKTPETATFNGGTLQDTTVYISQDGGISAENTAAAFGTALGDGGISFLGTGQYNVAAGGTGIKTGYAAVTGSSTQAGTTVTAATGNPFTAEMVGRTFTHASAGSAGYITVFTSDTIIKVSETVVVSVAEAFTIGAGNAATITFTKDLDAVGAGGNYTIVASGYDGTNNQVMWGEATDRSAGSCDITFQTAGVPVPNLTETAVKWTWVIHGAKLKGS